MKMKHTLFFLLILLPPFWSCKNKSAIPNSANKNTSGALHPDNPYYSRTDTTVLDLPDAVWKKVLPDSVYQVARNKETEMAFTGKYWNSTGIGTYYCAACGNALFRSDSKFASTCGWPRARSVSCARPSIAGCSDGPHCRRRSSAHRH